MTRAHADQLVCDNVNVLALDDHLNYHRVLHARDFAIAGGVNLSSTAARVETLEAVRGDGSSLELTGNAPKVEFGGALTLIHNASEDKLVCSGEFEAADLRIAGTSTTVAQMMAEHAAMKDDIAALKLFVGMMPPPPPLTPPYGSDWPLVGSGCCRVTNSDTAFQDADSIEMSNPPPTSIAITVYAAGDLSRWECALLCGQQANCNGIEVNGCLSTPELCIGPCYLFNSGGLPLMTATGNCQQNGDQLFYSRP